MPQSFFNKVAACRNFTNTCEFLEIFTNSNFVKFLRTAAPEIISSLSWYSDLSYKSRAVLHKL